jgi:aspartokinase-like uncharacterized kinase
LQTVIRVIKVGGSLLDWPELPVALDAWLNEQSPASNVLIAGGGRLVDVIREACSMFALDDEKAHWLAIDAMSIHSRLLAGLVRVASFVLDFGDLRSRIAGNRSAPIVFDANQFLRHEEHQVPGCRLPHDWSVTSDSIAARVAEILAVDELVLLKSADPSATCTTTSALAEIGFVDRNFSAFDMCRFQRRFVNLRGTTNCPEGWKVEPRARGIVR